MLLEPRYVVTELEGFATALKAGGNRGPGLSCTIIDRHLNHRIVAAYRTEDEGVPNRDGREGVRAFVRARAHGREGVRAFVRARATEHVARLNAA